MKIYLLILLILLVGCATENIILEEKVIEPIEEITKVEQITETIEEIKETEEEKSLEKVKGPKIIKITPGISWQWQLQGNIDTTNDVDLYDIDLETPIKIINELKNKDITVICYFSAGSWEKFRDYSNEFPEEVLGNTLDGWPDEKWLDISNYQLFSDVIENRLDLAKEKGCDGVEADNVDAYQNNNGFKLTYQHQLNYNIWLANQAHERGLKIALKNDLDQVQDLVTHFDFAINEQCFEYEECEKLLPFIKQNKAVLGVEYEIDNFCDKANDLNFSWLKANYDLDGQTVSCN